jgi:nucleoid DNA-binding protein
MATVTKREMISKLSDRMGVTQQQSSDWVEAFLEELTGALVKGDEVTFRTFGSFEIKVAKGKLGRNPNRPEEEVRIPDRCVVRFRPGRELKGKVAELPTERQS